MSAPALWTIDAMASRDGRRTRRARCRNRSSGFPSTAAAIAPGEAFFAIQGDNRDGHDFVAAALAAKAGLAVDRRRPAQRNFPPTRRSSSCPMCLPPCALSPPPRGRACKAKVIGVTGSVGKTGTKEALRLALSKDGETHASVASYNNHWGVPLSLARCPASARYAVFEMGMNHEGEIEPLSRLVRPHVAIITTIAPVHLEFLGSLDQDRRRQGGDLFRRRAGRRGSHQSRYRAIRPSQAPRQRGRHRPHRFVRRA